jgi:hypothetical protein
LAATDVGGICPGYVVASVTPEGSKRAPDEVIRDAQDRMQALVRTAEVTGDPSAPVLQGLAAMLNAMHVMTAGIGSQIEIAQQPIPIEELRQAVARGISAHAIGIAESINRAVLAAGVAASVLVLAATFWTGYWYRGDAPVFAGIRAGADQCTDQPDGSRLCYIPIYTRLPTTRPSH